MDEAFLLVSLKEQKSKELAQVISNDTSRKILDLLSKKSKATESEIAEVLRIPISTAHYNLQHLTKAKLVQTDEFHYSEKGKVVNHYSLSNKLIIIAPKGAEKVREKLKAFLPVMLIMAAGSFIIQAMQTAPLTSAAPAMFAERTAMAGAEADVIAETVKMVTTPEVMGQQPIALWFFLGALGALILYYLVTMIAKRE